ncbi:hypothetical protein AM493_11280 [Flavobacterium akiainvivens]|uniref:DUF4369 domain-containing protein n=1 Tax=Flavobacterium akiainvivens TaxID=1202724 RepID=A0A0M9VIE1_9FLAO|nr:hypothetical protein [Flavobacterium akiainvivens]KOS06552.1 hypothetical protein AM493_11280 [Flavobacterium akiainvivens]SFQ10716.1 hypothetical protein SAMN05444144_101102 [Flavobacterium akiainvivens]
MNVKKLLLLLFALLPLIAVAQRDTLHGRVMVAGENASGVYVINKNTGAEVKSAAGGVFKLPAKAGDRLVVYSDRVEVREFVTGKDWFANMPYTLEVQPQGYELEEVVINQSLSAEALGIVPKGQKRNTVAERRLYTATGDRPLWQYAIGLLAGSMPLDPFINAVTGKTKKLKKELATEQMLANVESVRGVYTTAQLAEYLDIATEQADGFLYYAAESPSLIEAIKANNNEKAKLELTALAVEYNRLQAQAVTGLQVQQQRDTLNYKTTRNPKQ